MLRAVALISVLALSSVASGDATLTVTTTPSGGAYGPDRNIVVAWIEESNGTFVRTIKRHANTRKQHLVAWTQKAGTNDIDAVSGGTRNTHGVVQFKWNLRDRNGQVLPDANYVMRTESAYGNTTAPGQNNQGTFPFVKSNTSVTTMNLASGGFTNGTLVFNNTTGGCENGLLEAGEVCDLNCPTSCPASTIMCFSNNLVGSPQLCNAQCANQPIMECVADDGCCPDGCEGMDSDCPGGGGGGGGEPEELSNCSTSSKHPGLLLIGLVIGLVVLRRRR
jgi:hypothetical protein